MQKNRKRKWKAGFLLLFMAGILAAWGISVNLFVAEAGETVSYIDEKGAEKTHSVTALEGTYSAEVTLKGWYIVKGTVTASAAVVVSGDVHLILADGAEMICNNRLVVSEGNSLSIYGQSGQTGKLTARTAVDGCAPIGSGENKASGEITINGGTVEATVDRLSFNNEAAIGSGRYGASGTITINGGTVKATSFSGAAIGSGLKGKSGEIVINGGTVEATCKYGGAAIGSGDGGASGTITINGGTVEATGGYGAAIGSGHYGASGTITINGGTVVATVEDDDGFPYGAAIGSGTGGDGGEIVINGGTVKATAFYGAAIGSGLHGKTKGTFTANGTAVIFATSISDTSYKTSDSAKGIIFVGDTGKIYGNSYELQQDLTIPSGKTLNINEGDTLTIPKNLTLENNGTIKLYGKISNEGTITNNGDILYAGSVECADRSFINNGTIRVYDGTLKDVGISGAAGNILYRIKTADGCSEVQIGGDGSECTDEVYYAKEGTTITLSCDSLPDGKVIDKWKVDDKEIEGDSDTMPGAIITVGYTTKQKVSYIDENGGENTCNAKVLNEAYLKELAAGSSEVTLAEGWYIVEGTTDSEDGSLKLTSPYTVVVSGDVHLILADNTELICNKRIDVSEGNSLSIYGQKEQTGKLTAGADRTSGAAIGSVEDKASGEITINGGTVNAAGDYYGAAIGSGYKGASGTITINGGNIKATAGTLGAAIGSGSAGTGGTITINGGTVEATGIMGAAIGSGNGRASGEITINGGTVVAASTGYGAAIGCGNAGASGTITINGGTVEATSGEHGAAIGSGKDGTITIGGGTVTATRTGSEAAIVGNFTANGTAVIFASSISDTSYETSASTKGIIFVDDTGKVYGDSYELQQDLTIPSGKTLNINEGVNLIIPKNLTLENNGTIKLYGTITNNGDILYAGIVEGADSSVINNGKIRVYDGTLEKAGTIEGEILYRIKTADGCSGVQISGEGSECTDGVYYAKEGTTITLSCSSLPDGKVIDKWNVNDEGVKGNSFTMPGSIIIVGYTTCNATHKDNWTLFDNSSKGSIYSSIYNICLNYVDSSDGMETYEYYFTYLGYESDISNTIGLFCIGDYGPDNVCENIWSKNTENTKLNRMGGKLTLSAPDNLVYDGSSKSVKITWDGYIKSYLTNAFTSTITYEIKDKNGSYVPLNSEPTKVGDYRATYKLTVISNADEDDMDSTSGSTTYSAYVEYSIVQAAEAPNKPSSELTPAHTVKTVSEVELPSGWQWSEGSGSEALADNTSVTATAKYAGADAGNYEIESVEITIIRQPCSHKGGTATCVSGATCENCGTEYTDKNAANHTGNTGIINAKSETCTENGYTGDTICSDCETILESGTEIKATGHTGGTATCASGAKCENCGTEYTDKNASNHTGNTEIINAKSETCTENGYTGDTICSDCEKVLGSGTEIKATGHTGGTATCASGAICENCGTEYTDKNAANHTGNTEIINAKAATCTEDGYTGDKICSDCKKVLESGAEISATGHTGGTATCTEQATCTACGKPYGELTAHTGGTATCVNGAKCENCGTEYTDKNAANHTGNTEIISAKSETCTENGYTGDTICSDCKKVLESGTEIKAAGHTGGTATCTEQAACTICGNPYGGLIAHTGGMSTCTEQAICTICGKPYGELAAHTGGTATCVSGAKCENCGTEYTDKNAANHTGNTEIISAKAATCTENGYTGDTICLDCKTVLGSGTEIKAIGHTGGTATCTEQATCTACGKPYGELTAHVGGTATCVNGAICTICGKPYGGLIAHTGGTATCASGAICENCGTEYTDKNAANHTGNTEIINAKAATCTESGYTGDKICSDCKTVLESGTETKAAGHTGGTATCTAQAICTAGGKPYGELTAHAGGTATCASGAICETCGTEYTDKNAANHTGNTEIINAKAATCTEDGYTGDKICSDCKTVLGSGTEISATGHTGGTATCAEQAKCEICGKPYGELIAHTGGTATCAIGAICENCGTEYTELLAHSYVAEVTKTPSATEEGIRTYTCENCGHSYTESIPKIESPYIEGEDGVQGWDAIRQKTSAAIEEALANPGKEKTVTVLMNGEVTVPGDIFTQIKGQNVTIVFDMGDGIKWSVDGKSVVNDSISDINFGIYTDEKANTIPSDIMADVINNVTGRHYTANLTLAYDGEFGFTAVMSIGLDAENAGYYANLFYYNKTDSRLDFVCADRIAADGTAKLAFTHASDYTIVIEAESLDPNAAPSEEPTTEPTTAKPTTEPTTTAKPTTEPTTEPTTAKPTTEPTTTKPTTAKPTTEPTTTAAATTETPATAASTAEAAAESPKTGDKAKAPLAVLLMLISEIGVAVCVMPRRKKN